MAGEDGLFTGVDPVQDSTVARGEGPSVCMILNYMLPRFPGWLGLSRIKPAVLDLWHSGGRPEGLPDRQTLSRQQWGQRGSSAAFDGCRGRVELLL